MITDGYDQLKQVIEHPPANVKFIGIVDRSEMNDLYNASDVFLTTSFNELFPMAILEAVNVGIPIVVRDLDLYEQIYFTDYPRANTVEEFVNVLETLRTSSGAYEAGQQASRTIDHDYSEEHVAQLWKDYYRGFLERHT